jgi:hypothetical protein
MKAHCASLPLRRTLGALTFLFTISLLAWAAVPFQLTGTVSTQAGGALPGAVVEVINPTSGSLVASASTDGNGTYALSVDGGVYNIRVVPPAGSNLQPSIILNKEIGGNVVLDFLLVSAGTVALGGRVTDITGAPIPSQSASLYFGPGAATTTDASGNYYLQVAPGSYRFRVEGNRPNPSFRMPDHYQMDMPGFDLLALQQNTTLDVFLPVKKVTVHVQDPSGNPLPGVAV